MLYLSFFICCGFCEKVPYLLYMSRNIFCIGRRNHSQIVQYLCSLYLQESLLICTVTSLFAVKFTVKSNRRVPFFNIGSRILSQIVLYLSALYSLWEALSNCTGNILHLPPPPPHSYSKDIWCHGVHRVENLSPAMGRGIDSRNRVWH